MLFRTPAFSLAAIVVLALGLGATTAIFTLFERLILSPLAYPDADRLVWIHNLPPSAGAGFRDLLFEDFKEIRRESHVFDGIGGMFEGTWNVTGQGEPVHASGARVTPEFFTLLGAQPALGRPFLAGEYHEGHENAAIFSHSFWLKKLGGDTNIIGRRVTMDGRSFEVVGILPKDFPLEKNLDLFAPLPEESPYLAGRQWRMVQTFARLKRGVQPERAQAELSSIAADLSARFPDDRGYGLRLTGFLDREVGSVRQTLWIFAAAVGCILLIACANVASLLLARGASRVREMAVRAAVGASRGALIRQLLIESAILAAAAAALSIPIGFAGVRLLIALDAQAIPRAENIQLDFGILAFAFALALGAALTFGIVPALRGSRVGLRDALTEGGRSGSAGAASNRLRSALVVAEVALGVVLLASAGLLARSFQRLTEVRPGYDALNVTTMEIDLSDVRYENIALCERFFERVMTQLELMPGVRGAGSTNYLPLVKNKQTVGIWLDSEPVHSEDTKIVLDNRVVSPGYFRAMGVPLIAGRYFAWTDRADSPNVLIVNEAFARQLFPRGDALGKRVTMAARPPWTGEIVGIAGSFRETSLTEEPRREIFTSLSQTTIRSATLAVRTAGTEADAVRAVRSAIDSMDPDVAFYDVRTMQRQISDAVAQPRLRGALLGVFSTIALILAALGVYGVIACSVAERRKEIGIRVALGAQPSQVRAMVVGQGLKLTGVGLVIGLVGAAAATRWLESFLFGVSPNDPVTYVATCALFAAVALIAGYLPARSAMRVDPIASLRED
jgi:putative ABC transport system permease protein